MTVEYVGVPVPEFLTSGTSCFSAFDVLVVFQKVFNERQSEDVAADDYHSFAEGACQHERFLLSCGSLLSRENHPFVRIFRLQSSRRRENQMV